MAFDNNVILTELKLSNITLPNRIVRSATYEGWGDSEGNPSEDLSSIYKELALGGVGTIITGFVYVSKVGRAMHPAQCGIDTDDKILKWKKIIDSTRNSSSDVKLIMQIAHTGRQTKSDITGFPVVGVSSKRCNYFREKVKTLNEEEIWSIIDEFSDAALRAREAGFDAIQLHCAHGYLIHQFLSPWTNTRRDRWSDPNLFLMEVINSVRKKCGNDFPVFIKLSESEDNSPGIGCENTKKTINILEDLKVDAVEISYGTMEYALNIIRGAVPIDQILSVNPMFNHYSGLVKKMWKKFCLPAYTKKFIPFSENYNFEAALRLAKTSTLPIIVVGGIRSLGSMLDILSSGIDAIALCRPLICEPDIPRRIINGSFIESKCTNCNLCTINCDGPHHLKCYQRKDNSSE